MEQKALYLGKPISDSKGGYLKKDDEVVIVREIPSNSNNNQMFQVRKGDGTHMVFSNELSIKN